MNTINNNHIEKAYKEIASSKGFSLEGTKAYKKYGSVGETQGTKEFREMVSRYAHTSPDLLSASNRRKYRHLNPALFRIIQYKLAGHIFNINDKFFIEDNEYDFEGFSEDVMIPCLWSYLSYFFKSDFSYLYSDNEKEWILEKYSETLSHHRMEESSLKEVIKSINSGKREDPVFIIGGYNWHGVAYAFINGLMLYWNSNYEGIKIYELEKQFPKLILKAMIKRQELTKELFIKCLDFTECLTNDSMLTFKKKKQKCGNCIYKASKGLLQIIIALAHALKQKDDALTSDDISKALESTKNKFKIFADFLKRQTEKELLEDLKSQEDPSTIRKILKKVHENEKAKKKNGGLCVFSQIERNEILRNLESSPNALRANFKKFALDIISEES